jgi:hypothetical protein
MNTSDSIIAWIKAYPRPDGALHGLNAIHNDKRAAISSATFRAAISRSNK